jgi:hypothetical protein
MVPLQVAPNAAVAVSINPSAKLFMLNPLLGPVPNRAYDITTKTYAAMRYT